jgi:hypothetical protein
MALPERAVRAHLDPHPAYPEVLQVKAKWLALFEDPRLQKRVRGMARVDLQEIGELAYRRYLDTPTPQAASSVDIHRRLRQGVHGAALYISAGMAFETMADALPFFELTNKTARSKLDGTLSPVQSEHALRLAAVASMAADYFGSHRDGLQYLHEHNFGLGGLAPIELLGSAMGEDVVVQELIAQIDGGPV